MATDNLARGLAATKLSKKGGTIAGDLEITGDLNVRGTTVTTRQETLFIKDNMIVTNADGKTLQGASGIAIRSGQSVVYGLVYEPISDTVMFGQGSLDSNNNFTFNSGEGLPIAIRADSSLFVDGHFVKWDATQYCFVDGGSVADIPNQKPFKESWTTTSFTALIADVYADTTVVAGDVYIGTVSGGIAGGMPFNGNAEVRIEVNTANRGVLHCEVTSSNVEPYHWECQVVSGVIYSWRSWVLTKPDGTNDLISNNKINNTYLDTDSSPTEDSTKPVQSGGVYTALSDKLGTSGDGSSTTVAFTEAQERTNVATGETQATLWGKVKKWFTDLKTVAFTGSYSDLSGKPTIPTALNDLTTDLTASRALVSNASGKVSASSVTSTELGYVSGVTSAIQTQLNGKLGTSGDGSSTTVAFTDASSRTNVATGETQATLWGKVKKWFTDLGTASFKNVPATGDATTTEVVMGNDTRLTNARNAADVYSWAKAATKPTYTYSEIQNTPTIPAPQVNSDWNATSGVAEILNKPTIPAAQVNSDWNAESGVAAILNKPTIPAAQVNSDWNATSGVAQILNKPTIPTQTSDLTNNGNGTLHEGETDPFVTQSFVNSSIASNTANFIGTFQNIPSLTGYTGTVTNNDYAFVVNSVITNNGNDFTDFATLDAYDKTLLTNFDYAWVVNGTKFDLYRFDIVTSIWNLRVQNTEKSAVTLNTAYNRYKAVVSGSTVTWSYEYTLNNSSFTAAQWAAINSNITSSLTSQITTNANNISGITNGTSINTFSGVESALSGKQATITGAATTITSSNLTASKALVSDTSGKVAVSAVTSTELGYVSGVTSAIQTQLNGKLGTSGDGSSTTVTFTEASSRTNVATGETQATLWGKVKKWFADLKTVAFTGSYSDLSGKPTIPTALNDLTTDLTASKALVSDANGKVSASSVTSTELGYVSGVTSAIQTQFNGKLGTSGDGSSTTVTFTDAQTRTNVATGETQATLWGKVKKWFADLGTAAFKNVPVSGDASTTEVVMGDDTRLTNARNAADVYSWAKAATKPTYSYSEITDTPTIGNGQLKLQKNGSEIGGFYANTSYDNTIDIKSYDLRDYMRFGTDGIYWNLWASTDATDDFLSTLTLDPDAQVAACIVRFNGGIGIYSVPLANMGGTGYAIAIVDETTFTPQVLLYVSVADTTNTNILLTRFGLTATDDGWQVSDQLVASGHTFLGSTTMSIPAGGVMPNDRGENKIHRVDAFFGSSNAQWQSLDALYGVVLGDVNTQLTALNSGAGV